MFERILVPIDQSEHAEKTLNYAIQLAKANNAHIHVVNVYRTSRLAHKSGPGVDGTVRNMLEDSAKELVQKAAQTVQDAGLPVTATVIRGATVASILHIVYETRPSLVIVGSHGKLDLPSLGLGSTSRKLVQEAPVPVLVYK